MWTIEMNDKGGCEITDPDNCKYGPVHRSRTAEDLAGHYAFALQDLKRYRDKYGVLPPAPGSETYRIDCETGESTLVKKW